MSLFRDTKHGTYEDKEWTFIIEDVSVVTYHCFQFQGLILLFKLYQQLADNWVVADVKKTTNTLRVRIRRWSDHHVFPL